MRITDEPWTWGIVAAWADLRRFRRLLSYRSDEDLPHELVLALRALDSAVAQCEAEREADEEDRMKTAARHAELRKGAGW